jgi:hypothetical protein
MTAGAHSGCPQSKTNIFKDPPILLVIPESRSDIRDPVFGHHLVTRKTLDDPPFGDREPRLASPSAVKNRGNDENRG